MAAPKAESSLQNLSEVLTKVGISPTKFAEDSEIDRATVEKVIAGKPVRPSTIHRIREALDDIFDDRFSFELVDGENPNQFSLRFIAIKKQTSPAYLDFNDILPALIQNGASDDVAKLEAMAQTLEAQAKMLRQKITLLSPKSGPTITEKIGSGSQA